MFSQKSSIISAKKPYIHSFIQSQTDNCFYHLQGLENLRKIIIYQKMGY